jgi:hypothetical protein
MEKGRIFTKTIELNKNVVIIKHNQKIYRDFYFICDFVEDKNRLNIVIPTIGLLNSLILVRHLFAQSLKEYYLKKTTIII